MKTLTLFTLILTTWRLSSLVANETGPFYIFKRIRRLAATLEKRVGIIRAFHLYELVECEWCNSIWIGLGITVLYHAILPLPILTLVTLPFVLSAGTISIKYTIQALQAFGDYLTQVGKSLKRSDEFTTSVSEYYYVAEELSRALLVASNRIEYLKDADDINAIPYVLEEWVTEARDKAELFKNGRS